MKALAIVLSVLMFWTFSEVGTQRLKNRSNGPPIGDQVRQPIEAVGSFKRKFSSAEPLVDEEVKDTAEETVPRRSPPDRSLFDGLVKAGERCDCPQLKSNDVIKAADYNVSSGNVTDLGCGFPVVRLKDRQFVAYFNVDFGQGVKVVTLRVANGSPETTDKPFSVFVYLDRPRGAPIALLVFQPTGDWCEFVVVRSFLYYIPKGVHDLYLVGSCDERPEYAAINLDWFKFDSEY